MGSVRAGTQAGFLLLLILALIGCASVERIFQPPPPVFDLSCFPESVFTAEEMRARVDCHPEDYKLEISDDVVVLFAFPAPTVDWVGPVFVIHVPSVSSATLDSGGQVVFESYNSDEGRAAIEAVLNDQAQMDAILERLETLGE